MVVVDFYLIKKVDHVYLEFLDLVNFILSDFEMLESC